jgi:hypothetical protein
MPLRINMESPKEHKEKTSKQENTNQISDQLLTTFLID